MTVTKESMMAALELDGEARRRIREELDSNFLVEAGAGSGKTSSLVDRMTSLVASGHAGIESLAAVTFTRKAAAEMRGRFQLSLERKAAEAATDPEVRARVEEALGRFEQGFIGTIHSFCSLLVRERPIEAGIDPDFEELDEAEDAFFREKCWHEFLDEVRLGRTDILEKLDAAGLSAPDLEEAFEQMSDYPEAEAVPGAAGPPSVEELRGPFVGFHEGLVGLMPKKEPEKGWDTLQRLTRRLGWRLKNLDHQDIRVLMESLSLCEKEPGVTLNRWPSKEEARAAEDIYLSFQKDRVVQAMCSWREFRHTAALSLLLPALDYYKSRRRRDSKLNFCDQLLVASTMLAESPEVRRFFRKRFKCILVDEFQDTDPIQAAILFYLTGSDVNEKDWTRIRPEPGSLFLVGDPKQSIYRFRRADIDMYKQVKKRLLAGGGEVVELMANFRTVPSLVDRINEVFKVVFPVKKEVEKKEVEKEEDDHQAAFAPLLARRSDPAAPPVPSGHLARITVPRVARHTGERIAELDATKVAGFIAWAIKTGMQVSNKDGSLRRVEPGDFLVLFRYKKNMGLYAAELERRGVVYEVFGSEAFALREEIIELRKVLSFLASPSDPVLAVSVLRGLFFGASDDDLLAFREAGGSFSSVVTGPVPESAPLVIRRGVETLRRWYSWTGPEPASVVLERVVADSGLLVHLVPSERGGTRSGNVLKLIEVLRGFETRGMTSFRDAVAYLEERLEAGSAEEMSLMPGGAGAVRLMNLHKAKGLEAPIVILANPKGMKDHGARSHVARLGENSGPGPLSSDRPPGYFMLTKKRGYATDVLSQPSDWDDKSHVETEYIKAEETRLMYVAATRARDLLVISSYEEDLGTGKSWGVLDDQLCRGAAGEFVIPELEFQESGVPAETGGGRPPDIDPADIVGRAVELNKKKGKALRAGCHVETVTGLAHHDGAKPARPSGDYGMKWGSAVHIMLNGLGRGFREGTFDETGLAQSAMNALAAVDLDVERAPELTDYIRGILASDFWGRAIKAERVFFEVPFAISIGPGDPDHRELSASLGLFDASGGKVMDAAADAPFLLNGVMDLVFLEEGGWVVADYKSDRLEDPSGKRTKDEIRDVLARFYAPQVKLYTRYWERITGETVKETGLYFVSSREWVAVPCRPPVKKRGRS